MGAIPAWDVVALGGAASEPERKSKPSWNLVAADQVSVKVSVAAK